ncbi:hypothetical protein E5288_WYG019795 [Bos mutus]|uniref:THAP-type domain-containing protein n=1 Tax=Bos mutus TaxID=72004 RepID=A0A6B0RPP3_9CETA|nr:hypothetical protein [Bos mutus]
MVGLLESVPARPAPLRFPFSRPELLKEWVLNIGRGDFEPKQHTVICSEHFRPECFSAFGNRKNLKHNAVPTVFAFQGPPQLVRENTDPTGRSGDATSGERKLILYLSFLSPCMSTKYKLESFRKYFISSEILKDENFAKIRLIFKLLWIDPVSFTIEVMYLEKDIQEFYEVTLLNSQKSCEQKIEEANQVAQKWEKTSFLASCHDNLQKSAEWSQINLLKYFDNVKTKSGSMRMNISEQMTIGLDILKTSDYNMSVLLYCHVSAFLPSSSSEIALNLSFSAKTLEIIFKFKSVIREPYIVNTFNNALA